MNNMGEIQVWWGGGRGGGAGRNAFIAADNMRFTWPIIGIKSFSITQLKKSIFSSAHYTLPQHILFCYIMFQIWVVCLIHRMLISSLFKKSGHLVIVFHCFKASTTSLKFTLTTQTLSIDYFCRWYDE